MKSENETIVFRSRIRNGSKNDLSKSKISSKKPVLEDKLPENNPLLLFGSCFVDHSSRQFACIYDHCPDHYSCCKNELLFKNLDFHALHFHPEDRILWCEEVFPDILKFIDSQTDVEFKDYRFSFNHRYIRKDRSISQFLHEGSFTFADDKCLPVLNLKVFTEIGDIKSDETIVLSIFLYSADQGYQKVFTKVYANTHNSLLSPREMEIIRLCREGYSSKMIADKLYLSIHTVKNHKRNCMEKTLTHNITELINLCLKSHWL
ncbi:MAG: LuxR C-terminal-related transcriptional regulator [Bacteroidota bacterium]|nr:LuxR C-terminal-related transcriptional regulator [Bacteroidota bacterium]